MIDGEKMTADKNILNWGILGAARVTKNSYQPLRKPAMRG